MWLGKINLQDYAEPVGRWFDRCVNGVYVREIEEMHPMRIKAALIAWVGHYRNSKAACGPEPYVYTYLFRYDLALKPDAKKIVLKRNSRARLFAATVSKGLSSSGFKFDLEKFANR